MCDSHCGNQHCFNTACNAVALFEHQRHQSAQRMELIYIEWSCGHVIEFFNGEPARFALVKTDSSELQQPTRIACYTVTQLYYDS